ncbi:MAG TPA: glycosyltransferase [Thermoanaerobaculia bacterium]|nr:glycosyltransferase [Thermoanaerobaculia bacterium]
MKLVIFGLTLSSSWGNGHATIWRGLCRALHRLGHRVVFFERDVPYYSFNRDLVELPGTELRLYRSWDEILSEARREVADADVAMVTSYCPDGIAATGLVLDSDGPQRVFYDLDTPVTLARLEAGEPMAYIGPSGLGGFDLVLSYTGGAALAELRERLGARRVAPLYGSVDPEVHRPSEPLPQYQADLSYLGTYAADRQPVLENLLLEPARRLPDRRFVIAGAQYPESFPWEPNVWFVRHLPPADHPAFFASSPLTLNVTRADMARMGWCPSGRLFEAAACGTAVLSDTWEGLGDFFEPGREILLATTPVEAMAAISLPRDEVARIARAARERALAAHTADQRAREMLEILASSGSGSLAAAPPPVSSRRDKEARA